MIKQNKKSINTKNTNKHNILVINSGSSSIKYKLFEIKSKKVLSSGHVDGIGLDFCVFNHDSNSEKVLVKNHDDALKLIFNNIDVSTITAVGHRFVHGGSMYVEPTIISDIVLNDLKSLSNLAPLHNPHNLEGIIACKKLVDVPQVAVFDTAFYKDLPKSASTYALPKDLSKKHNLKKFGFHGISHKFLAEEVCEFLGRDKPNIISCHLGNGASISCIKHSSCIDTSMGFTPLQGLVMGSRSGDIDPGIIIHLQKKLGLSIDDIDKMLNKESGLKGLSGESDMRKVYEAVLKGDEVASLALDVFCHRIIHYIGAYLALMKADTHAIIFSGGIGEGAFYVRKKVCDSLKHMGVVLDYDKNMENNGWIKKSSIISDSSSKIKVLVIPTDEELMIAQETNDLINMEV